MQSNIRLVQFSDEHLPTLFWEVGQWLDKKSFGKVYIRDITIREEVRDHADLWIISVYFLAIGEGVK